MCRRVRLSRRCAADRGGRHHDCASATSTLCPRRRRDAGPPFLRKRFKGPARGTWSTTLFFVAEEVRELLAEMGFRSPRGGGGAARTSSRSARASTLERARGPRLLRACWLKPAVERGRGHPRHVEHQAPPDRRRARRRRTHSQEAQPRELETRPEAVDDRGSRSRVSTVRVGAMLLGARVAKRYVHEGLPDGHDQREHSPAPPARASPPGWPLA